MTGVIPKLWIVATGFWIVITVVLVGCQLPLGISCGDGWCPDEQICTSSNSSNLVLVCMSCGNGRLDPDEQCDDGNRIDGDGCSSNCMFERCGNGILDPGEQCDDGNLNNQDGCEQDCTLPKCGNGILDPGEECDGDNPAAGIHCSPTCFLEKCGNGIRDLGEQCDDGNQVNQDDCEQDCTLPKCGNGILDKGEQCDDGNLINNDGCQANCTLTAGPRFPSTCAQIANATTIRLHDGGYRLFVGEDPSKSWPAYCRGMASGASSEYLSLGAMVNANFSQYTAGGQSLGTNVRTYYTRVRIDPVALGVDTSDQTFSISSGALMHGSTDAVSSMTYGAAEACRNDIEFPVGIGNIDLRGTPFEISSSPNPFVVGGGASMGTAVFSNNHQVVDLTGFGSCGWISPGVSDPFNHRGGALQLVYP